MERTIIVIMAICAIGLYGCTTSNGTTSEIQATHNTTVDAGYQELNLNGWSTWGIGLQVIAQSNTITLNGTVDTAGYVNANLNPNMRNKTLILEIKNADASEFSQGRMFKITINKDDTVLAPNNIGGLIYGEYIPETYNMLEFILPDDFDGKLGFVFYQASLKDLVISAWLR